MSLSGITHGHEVPSALQCQVSWNRVRDHGPLLAKKGEDKRDQASMSREEVRGRIRETIGRTQLCESRV